MKKEECRMKKQPFASRLAFFRSMFYTPPLESYV
jgi:hypothetical protein